MALNTRKALRSAVRARLGEPVPREGGFTEEEINIVLSYNQHDIVRKLLELNRDWFLKSATLQLDAGDGFTVPSDLEDVVGIYYNGIPVKRMSAEDIGLFETNSNFLPSLTQPFYVWRSDVFIVYPDTITSGLTCWYLEAPEELDTDNATTIVPVQFCDLLVLSAVKSLAPRADKVNMEAVMAEWESAWKSLTENYLRDERIKIPVPGEE